MLAVVAILTIMKVLKTVGEAKDYLLQVMDFATDEQSRGNKSLTKEDAWNLFIGATIGKSEGETIHPIISDNILREFPEYLISS
jgi:hypothetical protein